MNVRITELDLDGHGRGRHGERWVRIRGALPGDTWQIGDAGTEPHREKDAADRRTPTCPVADACGGCDLARWQPHAREAGLRALVQRVLGLSESPSWHSDPNTGRARIQLHVHDGRLAYRAAGSHDPVTIADCEIAHAAIRAVLPALAEAVAADVEDGARLELRTNGQRVVFGLEGPGWLPAAQRRIARLGAVAHDGRAVAGDPALTLDVHGITLRASPGAFFQVHPSLNAAMVAQVCEAADAIHAERALDLFAGIGNFTLPLAARGRPVHAVELAGASVRDLRATLKAQPMPHVTVESGDATAYDPRRLAFDFAVVDPPRAGAGRVLDRLVQNRPKRIVLISCDLGAARHDHKRLLDAGYARTAVDLYDLFPQTHHVEVVGVFDRAR